MKSITLTSSIIKFVSILALFFSLLFQGLTTNHKHSQFTENNQILQLNLNSYSLINIEKSDPLNSSSNSSSKTPQDFCLLCFLNHVLQFSFASSIILFSISLLIFLILVNKNINFLKLDFYNPQNSRAPPKLA